MEASFMSYWNVPVPHNVDFKTFTYHCDLLQKDIKDTLEQQKKQQAKLKSRATSKG